MSIGNIRSAQKAFRVPQSSVFCHFHCFIEISPKNPNLTQGKIVLELFNNVKSAIENLDQSEASIEVM